MATTLADASVLEHKVNTDEQAAEPQELDLGHDTGDVDGLLLHLIRTIALYLFVFLSQTAKLVVTDTELAVFVSDTTTPDLLDTQTRLHAALFAWVKSEVNSNQFDGLLQEQRAFVVIKRLFRQQRTKASAQCRVLAALLTSYLTQLETPLVHCERTSMLSSTLEYLLANEKNSKNKEPVPLPMLYPLVNAIDLVSIEQRECLDALMNLLRWLTARDQSQKVFTAFASKYHVKIIGMEGGNDTTKNTLDIASVSRVNSRDSHENNSKALSVCFVQMLLRYSDHIFRRDLQFEDIVPTLTYSDTEDDDVSSEDVPDSLTPASPAAVDTILLEKASSNSPEIEQSNKKSGASVPEVVGVALEMEKAPIPSKVASRALRKRKKREEKVAPVGTKTTRRANKFCSKLIQEMETKYIDEKMLLSQAGINEEPLPAVVCVGIAAAAGTIAAVLCAFFSLPTQ
ncbi:uncharacterized protein KRP23_2246 [Phytophthora ramorum]|uniref:uncharacterized protein n=1 Tax=Phytophthora ramorum TaxID=164328 RepID=UPI003098CAA4|nr:hypothetical protein KRP23_2246 [Phytophthora ramorum]